MILELRAGRLGRNQGEDSWGIKGRFEAKYTPPTAIRNTLGGPDTQFLIAIFLIATGGAGRPWYLVTGGARAPMVPSNRGAREPMVPSNRGGQGAQPRPRARGPVVVTALIEKNGKKNPRIFN